jgi:hypothetical protein
MMKTFLNRDYFLLLVIAVGQLACGVTNIAQVNTSNNGNTIGVVEKPVAENIEENKSRLGEKKDYFGCWSNGRGMDLQITGNEIRVSPDFVPAPYREEKANPEDNSVLLFLTDRPEGQYFQKYILIRFKEEKFGPLMSIRDYSSYQELIDDKNGSTSGWTKDDCNKLVLPPVKKRS